MTQNILFLMGAALPVLVSSPLFACDFGHAIFKRSDGATIVANSKATHPGWFKAQGIAGIAGFATWAGNCALGCVAVVPMAAAFPMDADGNFDVGAPELYTADGNFVEAVAPPGDFYPDAPGNFSGAGDSIDSDGQDAWPGGPGDPAPSFVWIADFGTFYRVCFQ